MENLNFDLEIGMNNVMGIMIKILMVLITLLSLVMIKQVSLMGKVVNVPVGGNFKLVSWFFFWACLVLTGIVVLVS